MRLRNAFKYSVFEASELVSTKTLVLKHYYRRQGCLVSQRVSGTQKQRNDCNPRILAMVVSAGALK